MTKPQPNLRVCDAFYKNLQQGDIVVFAVIDADGHPSLHRGVVKELHTFTARVLTDSTFANSIANFQAQGEPTHLVGRRALMKVSQERKRR